MELCRNGPFLFIYTFISLLSSPYPETLISNPKRLEELYRVAKVGTFGKNSLDSLIFGCGVVSRNIAIPLNSLAFEYASFDLGTGCDDHYHHPRTLTFPSSVCCDF